MTAEQEYWHQVEQIAQQHELRETDHYLPVAPVPAPTQAQQLMWATNRAAELQARLYRLQSKAGEVLMWLQAGEHNRAKLAVNAIILDMQ